MLGGKVAVVTGASRGLGLAICDAFLDADATVVSLDFGPPDLNTRTGRDIRCDVADANDCCSAINRVVVKYGQVDILVNCAGILIRGNLESATAIATFEKTMQVNVGGIVNMVRASLPELKKTAGVILNIASIQSFIALPNSFAYNASKGAVLQLTKALAAEFAGYGIRVNGIAPGWMETQMNEDDATNSAVVKAFLARVPLNRFGAPEDIGGPAVFLCSNMSRYITGTTLPVDGGFLAV